MAYPQAPAEMPLYMHSPQGYKHKGVQTQRNVKEKRVWAKAGQSCMEQIHGPGHEGNRFQAQRFRSMSLLPRGDHLPRLHRRLHHLRSRRTLDRRRHRGLTSMLPPLHR